MDRVPQQSYPQGRCRRQARHLPGGQPGLQRAEARRQGPAGCLPGRNGEQAHRHRREDQSHHHAEGQTSATASPSRPGLPRCVAGLWLVSAGGSPPRPEGPILSAQAAGLGKQKQTSSIPALKGPFAKPGCWRTAPTGPKSQPRPFPGLRPGLTESAFQAEKRTPWRIPWKPCPFSKAPTSTWSSTTRPAGHLLRPSRPRARSRPPPPVVG